MRFLTVMYDVAPYCPLPLLFKWSRNLLVEEGLKAELGDEKDTGGSS